MFSKRSRSGGDAYADDVDKEESSFKTVKFEYNDLPEGAWELSDQEVLTFFKLGMMTAKAMKIDSARLVDANFKTELLDPPSPSWVLCPNNWKI